MHWRLIGKVEDELVLVHTFMHSRVRVRVCITVYEHVIVCMFILGRWKWGAKKRSGTKERRDKSSSPPEDIRREYEP